MLFNIHLVAEFNGISRGISDEMENRIRQFSNLYGMVSEIGLNCEIAKRGSGQWTQTREFIWRCLIRFNHGLSNKQRS